MKTKSHIRWMLRRDMPEVIDIEHESFEFPWTDDDFIRRLRQRNCIGIVAEHEGRVVGFMIYELHRTRIHVLNFAVAKASRRSGIGSQMVAKLKSRQSEQRRSRLVMDVSDENTEAHLFLRSNGFRATSIIEGIDKESNVEGEAYHFVYRYQPANVAGRLQVV